MFLLVSGKISEITRHFLKNLKPKKKKKFKQFSWNTKARKVRKRDLNTRGLLLRQKWLWRRRKLEASSESDKNGVSSVPPALPHLQEQTSCLSSWFSCHRHYEIHNCMWKLNFLEKIAIKRIKQIMHTNPAKRPKNENFRHANHRKSQLEFSTYSCTSLPFFSLLLIVFFLVAKIIQTQGKKSDS